MKTVTRASRPPIFEPLESRVLLSGGGGTAWLIAGDVTNDGYVDEADAMAIGRMTVRLDPVNPNGDLSGDGKVNGFDSALAGTLGHFKQPYVFNGRTLDYTIYDGRQVVGPDGVLNVFAPDPSDMGSYWTVNAATGNADGTSRFPAAMATLWGPTGAPTLEAIHQGLTADCYLLAALGSLVMAHPADLMHRITLDGFGFVVEFNASSGAHVFVHVDARFSNNLQVNDGLPLWPKVVEKAYTWFRGWDGNGQPGNTFASIGWGYPLIPYEQFGWDAMVVYTGNQNATQWAQAVAGYLAAREFPMVQTSPSAATMVPSHVYVITAVYNLNGTWWVTEFNPWGFSENRLVSDLLANDINQLVVGTGGGT